MEHQPEHIEHTAHHAPVHPQPKKSSTITLTVDKRSFVAGVIGGIVLACVAGFLIMASAGLASGFPFGGAKTIKKVADTAGTNTDTNTEPTNVKVPDVTTEDWIRGDKKASITIIEYSDTECPFCKRFHTTLTSIVEANKGTVNWVYRHFPLASLHAKAPKEAEALECAGKLGGNEGFWKYLDRLMEITPGNDGLDAAQLPEIAKFVGLNVAKFNTCYESGEMAAKVQAQYTDAVNAGGRGTPFSVIIGKDGKSVPLSGALPDAQVQAAIDSLK